MTNWEMMKAAIDDEIDDGGAEKEAFIYYNIECPHCGNDRECKDVSQLEEITREMCVRCKEKWLNEEYE